MKKILWNQELSVGVEEIDSQHKELLRIANGLIQAVCLGRNEKTINNVLKKLREYTVFHFNSEEKFMESIGYNKRAQHVEEHFKLKMNVKAFQREIYMGKAISPDDLVEFIKL